MKVLLKINWILITLLSISTGVFKVLQQEADLQLFAQIGFGATATTIVGIVQLAGGIMLIIPKTRMIGACIMIPTFVIATIAVFANGLIIFGIVSLMFILMAGLVFKMKK